MADKQITALTAASALTTSDLFFVSQGGNSRQATGAQVQAFAGGGAGPSVRGSGIQSSSNSSYTVSWPTGTVAGDRAIIFAGHGFGLNAIAGWTTLDNATGTNFNGAVFTRVLSSADITAGNVALTTTGSYNGVVAIVTLQGAGTVRTTNTLRNGTGASTATLNTDGSPKTSDRLILFGGNRGNSTDTCSLGTSLQTITASEGSGVLLHLNPAAAGGVSPLFSFTTAGTGYYLAAVAVGG